jgi:hypothetical protein
MRKFNFGDFVVVDNKSSMHYDELGKVVDLFYERDRKRTVYCVSFNNSEKPQAYFYSTDLILSIDKTTPTELSDIGQLIEKVEFLVAEARTNLDAIEGVLDKFRDDGCVKGEVDYDDDCEI